MDRRDFLRSTGGLAALATACAPASMAAAAEPSATAGPIRATIAHPWTSHHAGWADDAYRLARRLEGALNGAVALDLRAATPTRAEFTITPVQSETFLHPAFAYFGGLPGWNVLSPRDLESWLANGGGQSLWDDLAAPHGFKPLLAGHTGPDAVLWSRAPLVTPLDLAGKRVVARGLDADVLRALGAIPISADETSLEQALSSPATDAVIWGSLVHASAAGIPERFPFGLAAALGSGGVSVALEIDRKLWDGLTEVQQMTASAVAQSEFRASLADAETTRAAVTDAIAVRYGAIIQTPTPDFVAAVSRIAAALVAHTAAHDPMSGLIDRSYSSFRRALGHSPVNVA